MGSYLKTKKSNMKKLIIILSFIALVGFATEANAQTVNIQTSTIQVPTAKAATLRDAICYEHGYQDLVSDPNNPSGPMIPNPVSKATFAQAVIDARFKEWLKNLYRSHVQKAAAKAADSELETN